MRMIKRLICFAVLYFVAFFVGTLFSPNITSFQQQDQVQKENVLVQNVIEEKKEHQGVVIGHIVGQYQNIYKSQKTASAE